MKRSHPSPFIGLGVRKPISDFFQPQKKLRADGRFFLSELTLERVLPTRWSISRRDGERHRLKSRRGGKSFCDTAGRPCAPEKVFTSQRQRECEMGGKWKVGAQQNEGKNRKGKRSVRLNYEGDCKTRRECFIGAGGDGADGEDGEVFSDSPTTAAARVGTRLAREQEARNAAQGIFVRPRWPPSEMTPSCFPSAPLSQLQWAFGAPT